MSSSIASCFRGDFAGNWCDFYPTYEALDNVIWQLRDAGAHHRCHAAGLGFKRSIKRATVVWHVRTGDVCLHCHDVSYYTKLHARFERALGVPVDLHFESQNPLGWLSGLPEFANASFSHETSIHQLVCSFLTADVLITSGSSMPAFVAAFGAPWHPIVLEEVRKEAGVWKGESARDWKNKYFAHFFKEQEAVALWGGSISLSDTEMHGLFRSLLPHLYA